MQIENIKQEQTDAPADFIACQAEIEILKNGI